MKTSFDAVVEELRKGGLAVRAATFLKNAQDIDDVFKEATGFHANSTSKFDSARFRKLEHASKDDTWSFDAMKKGAIELQRMHPLLSAYTSNWTANAFEGRTTRPVKSGPQPNFAKELGKWLIHAMIDQAEEHGLTRGRHQATRNEKSAMDAVRVALEKEGLALSFDKIASFDRQCKGDPDQKSLQRFFPTEDF